MKAVSTYVAAAALAVGGFAFAGCDRDESVSTTPATNTPTDNRSAGDKIGDNLSTAADKTKDAAKDIGQDLGDAAQAAGGAIKSTVGGLTGANATQVPNMFGDVAEAALTKDGLDDLVERFVDADRNRIGKADLDSGNDQLNALAASIAADWKAKYNTEFDINQYDKVFGSQFMSVSVGELGKNAAGADVDINVDRNLPPGQTTRVNVDVDRKSGVDNPASVSADTNRNDPGRNVASVSIPASHGAAALSVPLIHEAGGWKIDVPDTLDAAKLRSNLIAHLTKVQGMKDQWPATAEEGYRAVTHHVLMAVMDKPVQ